MKTLLNLAPSFLRRVAILFSLIFVVAQPDSLFSAEPPPLKICLLSGSTEYESEKSLSEFQSYLESHYRIKCTRAFGKDKGDTLPGLEALADADLMIVFTRRVKLPEEQLGQVQKYLASGRPVIGIRTASHAFENYMQIDKEVFGGGYKGHYGDEPADTQIVRANREHPILKGVSPFSTRKLYKNPTLSDDVLVLLEASTATYREPVAWVREKNGARIFYTSLGNPTDFVEKEFREMLVNAIFWCTKRDESISRVTSGKSNLANAQSLFNGKDLKGWKAPEPNTTWRVRDGILIGENDEALKSSMLYTEKSYLNFILETDVRWKGEIDSGIMFRKPDVQLQFGVSRSLKLDMSGSFYTGGEDKYPMAGRGVNVDKLLKENDWNKFRLQAIGDVYTVWLNGQQITKYTNAKYKGAGPIGLQVHGGVQMKVEFRDFVIEELAE